MSDATNTPNTPTSPNDLAAMFQQSSSQPVPAPQQENPVTYNSTYDTTTDVYGAPIQQEQQQQQQSTQQPAPMQSSQPNQPSPEDQQLIDQLFDPNVETITSPSNNQQQPTNVFDQLAATIAAATNQQQQTNGQPTQLDDNGQPVNPVTAVFNEAYGEDVDFSAMMSETGDPAEINTAIQQSIREKMQSVYTGAITQSISLAQQLVKREIDAFTSTLQAQQSQKTALTTLNQQLPFTTKPEYSGLSRMILDNAMKKTNNNVQQSVQIVEKLFRLNNPALFDKPSNTRFGTPQQLGSNGPSELNLDTIDQFLG